MNARCYGFSLSDVLEEVVFLAPDTLRRERRSGGDFLAEFDYKKSPFQPGGSIEGAVITEAVFRLRPGNKEELWKKMREIEADRREKGHFMAPNAGSVFKNNYSFGQPAGKILDGLGLRGFALGGAQVSPLHGNIILNTGGATSADIRHLIELIQKRVLGELGHWLEPEILYAGDW